MASILGRIVGTLESPVIRNNFQTTTWMLIGACIQCLLLSVFSLRTASIPAVGILLWRVARPFLQIQGYVDNVEMKTVIPTKMAAMFPKEDGSAGPNPAGRGLALLILGVKISGPLGIFTPGANETRDFFQILLKDLEAHPSEHGWLGGSSVCGEAAPGENGHVTLIGYFKSMDDLRRFAHGPKHREAWDWWNRNAKNMPQVGVYHEAYDVPAKHWEAIYLQTPALGLGRTRIEVPSRDGSGGTEWAGVLTDARKGVWRSSAGRTGRNEIDVHSDDPYAKQ